MTLPTKEKYKKIFPYIKDFLYILGIIVSLTGWMKSKTKNAAILETTVKYNTKTIEKLEDFIDKQSKLNGATIQFMQHQDALNDRILDKIE